MYIRPIRSTIHFNIIIIYYSKNINSLFKNQTGSKQDKPELFAKKIKQICKSRKNKDFMVIARIESFIVGKGLKDALKRAEIYSKAGADAILIHSKEKTPVEIFSFAREFKKSKNFIPLVSVPSTYSKVYEKDLIRNGFKLVIYANQLLRAAYPAMQFAAKKILENSRAFEIEKFGKAAGLSNEMINKGVAAVYSGNIQFEKEIAKSIFEKLKS
jgi:phosphoenolpyruvate phosphomutase